MDVYLRILFIEIIRILYGTSSVDMSVRRLTETNPFPYINGNQPNFRTHQRKEIAIECKYIHIAIGLYMYIFELDIQVKSSQVAFNK